MTKTITYHEDVSAVVIRFTLDELCDFATFMHESDPTVEEGVNVLALVGKITRAAVQHIDQSEAPADAIPVTFHEDEVKVIALPGLGYAPDLTPDESALRAAAVERLCAAALAGLNAERADRRSPKA